jgi:hypothetical protein
MNKQKIVRNMQNFQFLLLTYWFEFPGFLKEVVADVRNVPSCGNPQNTFFSRRGPLHTYDTSRILCVTPMALHMRHLSCVSDGIGQCSLPQALSLATCDSTLGGPPKGLGTLCSGPACANIFITRVYQNFLTPTRRM